MKQGFIIVFALIALMMTAYATSGGARLILSDTYAWIGITALTVGFLAFTSLVLGDGITARNGLQVAVVLPFYLVAVILCWISSFASYHQQFLSVGGSDLANSETNLRQMGTYAHDIRRDVNDRYGVQIETLLDDPALRTYSAEMGDLSDFLRGRNSREQIEAQLQAQIEANKNALAERRRQLVLQEEYSRIEVDRVEQRVQTLGDAVEERNDAVAEIDRLIAQLGVALVEEEGDVTLPVRDRGFLPADSLAGQLVDDPACQRRRRVGTGGGLPGTCFNAIGETIEAVTADKAPAQEAVVAANAQLDAANDELEAATAALDRIVAEIETVDQEAADAEIAAGETLDADGFMESINGFVEEPSQSSYRQTADYCTVVTQLLADLPATTDLPECEPQAVTTLFARIDTLTDERTAFMPICQETERREEIIADLREDMLRLTGVAREKAIFAAYDTMRNDVLEACLKAADARGFDTTGYRADLAGLYDRINPSQDAISQAIGKVSALLNGTAAARDYFPALLALLQELSLLLAKLFWDANSARKPARNTEEDDISELDLESKPGDPGPVIAAKNLVLSGTYHRRGYLLPRFFDEEYSQEMRAHMRHIIEGLMRKDQATRSSAGVLVSEEGMASIARRIRQHEPEGAAADNASVTTGEPRAEPRVAENENAGGNVAPFDKRRPQREDVVAAVHQPALADDALLEAETADDDAAIEGRPRRRRPVVVRPSFRREP